MVNGPARAFGIGVTVYLLLNLMGRWLRTTLLQVGWGLEPPPPLVTLGLAAANAAPALLLGLLAGLLFAAGRWGRWAAPLAVWAAVVFVEADMTWYAMSHEHVTWRDMRMFAAESWSDHFGLNPAETRQFAILAGLHLAAIAVIAALSRHPWAWRLPACRASAVIGLAAALKLAVIAAGVFGLAGLKNVAKANPLYWAALDEQVEYAFARSRYDRIDAINAAIRTGAAERQASAAPAPATRPNILVVTIESWNQGAVTAEAMPFLNGLRDRCLTAANHHSTGNITNYGITGLLTGRPVIGLEAVADSPLALLRRAGYATRLAGGNLLSGVHGTIGAQLKDFSEAADFGADDEAKLAPVIEELRRPGPRFVHVHYWGTHFWYKHRPEFTRFTPETPEGFAFDARGMAAHHAEIVNRYRNTLAELDDWLKRLLGAVDTGKTIMVITGDHGEEMFETGRLGHGATLDAPQTRTPLLLCGPGTRGRRIEGAVTSHADLMPTVLDLIGIDDRSGFGRSLLRPAAGAVAVIAHNNYAEGPKVWRVVGESGWAELRPDGKGGVAVRSYSEGSGADDAVAGGIQLARQMRRD
jgi:glucan phosphoethanolaminetransferase (alkaline phosphatase superfamily)